MNKQNSTAKGTGKNSRRENSKEEQTRQPHQEKKKH